MNRETNIKKTEFTHKNLFIIYLSIIRSSAGKYYYSMENVNYVNKW